MRLGRFFSALILSSYVCLWMFMMAIPDSGYAGTPHPCPGGQHQGSSLGGGQNKTFEFRKNCASETSLAVKWKATVYNDSTGAIVCNFPETNLPPDIKTLNCGPAANPPTPAVPQYVKIVLSYKTSALGGWMTHTENFTNP